MMYFLMRTDLEFAIELVFAIGVFLVIMVAFIYCSIKLIKKKKIKYKLLGIICLVGTILSIIGLSITFIYSTYGERYIFRIANVLKVDNDKIYVRYREEGRSEDNYYELDRPFYATNIKEDDRVFVRFANEGSDRPRYFKYHFSSKFGELLYSVSFLIPTVIGFYYLCKVLDKKKGCDFDEE